MSIETSFDRAQYPIPNNIFQTGKIGNLMTLRCTPVVGGDSYSTSLVGSLRLSAMRRFLTLDATVDICTFYVPHRHIYGDEWIRFLTDGASTPDSPNVLAGTRNLNLSGAGALAISMDDTVESSKDFNIPKWRFDGYFNIYNNYFKRPTENDYDPSIGLAYPFACCHLKNMWSVPLPDFDEQNLTIDTSAGLNIFELNEQQARLHVDQSRAYFTQRFRDIVDSLGGSTTADVDDRPTLIGRTTFHTSGYDVDGTSETSLGQYVGRSSCSFEHNVPRFYCREHGAVWTVAVVRFPTVVDSENHYLDFRVPSYEEMVLDPVMVGNMPPVTIKNSDIFSGTSTPRVNEFKVPYGAWYREHPNYVSDKFNKSQGFPFIPQPPDSYQNFYVYPDYYNEIFQSQQFEHWQIFARDNSTVIRTIPTARDSMMASE